MKPRIHESACVDEGARVGDGTAIWHFSHVMSGAEIGEDCSLGQGVFVGDKVKIGNCVKIQNNVSLYEGAVLEDFVFCGPSVVFTNVINPRAEIVRKTEYKPTFVKRGATLGANCTILCGHTVGEYAFVAAGAVVTCDVPAYALFAGVPARQIGWICRCGAEKLSFQNGDMCRCTACGSRYLHLDDEVRPITIEYEFLRG
jgi:UDP-2-acetamido-3-amino-2,3-dideoxy-glucuronate N-acetyltransferase